MSFIIEREKQNRMSFLDVQICEDTSVYRNPTFSRVYTYFTCFYHLILPLVEFIHIFPSFYHLPIRLALFTHSLIDASDYAQVGLYYTLN